MRKFILVLACVLLIGVGGYTSPLEFRYKLTPGYSALFFDPSGSSFYQKIQNGFGFESSIEGNFNILPYASVGLSVSFPGLWFFNKSDSEGGFYYPSKFILPLSFSLKGNYKIQFDKLYLGEAGLFVGFALPTVLSSTYYYPTDILPGITAGFNYTYFLDNLGVPNLGFGLGFGYTKLFSNDDNFSFLSAYFSIIVRLVFSHENKTSENEIQIKPIMR
jgi:hypothetical protein